MYVVPGPVRAGHGPGQWRRVVGRAKEHGNGPDWHWALAPECRHSPASASYGNFLTLVWA
jgi:hypothetical protein